MIMIVEKLKGGKCIGICHCGVRKEFYTLNITLGKSKSCGCNNISKVPYAVRRTFNLMKYRCNTKTSSDYANWGAKGIKVLYKDVEEFYADVGDKPSKNHSIDRIDNTKSYQVGNCKWATAKEQMNNVSLNHIIEYKGERKTLAQWSELYNIKYTTLKERLKRGWSIEKSLLTKVESKFNSRS